ncbi:hypothetical protein BC830DRAFT_1164634 [Chytriomyces sp. MP71]|nr:hypothetical protein BC830DRAFT_1164634 [Chytriomyces sp. MP71]
MSWPTTLSPTPTGTTMVVAPTSEAYGYNSSNLLKTLFGGLQMGFAALLFVLILFVHRLFPKPTIATALALSLLPIARNLLSFVYDLLLLPDCFLRVKIIYSIYCVEITAYSFFLSDLTYKVSQSYPTSIPRSLYIIIVTFCGRIASIVYVVFSFTWKRGTNQVCASVLNPAINLIDKLVELAFYLVLSVLFLYPIIRGYHDISQYSSTSEFVNVGRGVEAGRTWLGQVIRDQGFLNVVTFLVQVVYVLCVFTGADPSLVSVWNSFFSGQYVLFMSIHLIATVMRKSDRWWEFDVKKLSENLPLMTTLTTPTEGPTGTPTVTAALAVGVSYGYSASNVLKNFLGGVQVGVAALLLVVIPFVHRLFPKRTVATALALALLLMARNVFSALYDLYLLPDCYFRVKMIYSATCVESMIYSLFLADLTYKVSVSYSKSISGTFYIIAFAFFLRAATAILGVCSITWARGPNQVCTSVLNPDINLANRIAELVYALVLSILFLYPVVQGYRDISAYSSSKESTIAQGAAEAGRNWLLQIIRDQGFLSVVTCLVQVVYVLCVFTGGNPSLVTLWNSVFAEEYVIFMIIHLVTTLMRKVGEAQRVGRRPVKMVTSQV